jgi:hypothetical protein
MMRWFRKPAGDPLAVSMSGLKLGDRLLVLGCSDPRLIAALAYATVTGIATEPEVLRGVGWSRDAAGLRRLRDELRAFLRRALQP